MNARGAASSKALVGTSAGSKHRRLGRAYQLSQLAAAQRAEAQSHERCRLIAEWHAEQPRRHYQDGMLEEEENLMDGRLRILAEEFLYRYELQHGPVSPLPYRGDEPSPWPLGQIPHDKVAGFCKYLLI